MPEGIDKILGKIEWTDINLVKEYDKNPKIHTEDQIEKLSYIFEKYGFDVPIIVDKNMVIIKGHARMAAAKKLKWKKVPIIVRSNLTPQQVKASRIADNKVAEAYWDIPALMEELEALYALDDPMIPITDTGFSESEIQSLLPGMMETEEKEYKIPYGAEGLLMGFMPRMQQDGKIGLPDPYMAKKSEVDFINSFDVAVIPTFGSAVSIASALILRQASQKIRLVLLHTTPGIPQFKDTVPYLEHTSVLLNAQFVNASPKDDSMFRDRISTMGYPSMNNLWCEQMITLPLMEEWLTSERLRNEKTVMILGATENQSQYFRRIGKFDQSYYYFNPCIKFIDNDLYLFLEENLPEGLGLHPMYKHFTSIACLNCPLYKAPDFAYMKNNMLKSWIKNLEYFGYSKRNKSYRYSDDFDNTLKNMIAESIEERAVLPYESLAMDSVLR